MINVMAVRFVSKSMLFPTNEVLVMEKIKIDNNIRLYPMPMVVVGLFRSAQLQGHNSVETIRSTAKMALATRLSEEILNCQLILFLKS
jgi:hypothetical protein